VLLAEAAKSAELPRSVKESSDSPRDQANEREVQQLVNDNLLKFAKDNKENPYLLQSTTLFK